MNPETQRVVPEFRPIEFRAKIHKRDQVVRVFDQLEDWLSHAFKHFLNPKEKWDLVLRLDGGSRMLATLRNRIPGPSDGDKEEYIRCRLRRRCQEKDPEAVMIWREACEVYERFAPKILQLIQQALRRPRYAHFPNSNPISQHEPGYLVTYAHGEPFPVFMVIRIRDFRSCYFLRGWCKPADLASVKSFIRMQSGIRRFASGYVDHNGQPAHPYTEESMGWSCAEPPRAWRFPPHSGGRR